MRRLVIGLVPLLLVGCAQPTPLPPTPTFVPTPTSTAKPLPPTATAVPPTATTQPPTLLADQPYVSQAYGYSLGYPAGWQAVEIEDVTLLVRDPAAIGQGTPVPAVTVSSGALDTFLGGALVGVSLEQAGAVMQAMVPQILGPTFKLGEAEPLAELNSPAIGTSLGGQDETGVFIEGYAVLLLTDQRAAVVLGSAPAEEWPGFEPLFRSLIATFTFANG